VPADRNLPYTYEKDGGRYDDKRIGLKLAQVLPPQAAIMTRSGRIGFYYGRRYTMPPQTDVAGLVAAARREKIDFLIVTPVMVGMRPQFEFLMDPVNNPSRPRPLPPELELVGVDQFPGGIPYLVYRFR